MMDNGNLSVWLMILIIAANFLYLLRAAKWFSVQKAFPLTSAGPQVERTQLSYGKANLCGHYVRNKVFSGFTRGGIVIEKPFPISLVMRPIFIPWKEIEQISIGSDLAGSTGTDFKKMFSSSEYAKIELKRYAQWLIVVPWQAKDGDHVPNNLAVTRGPAGS